MDWTRYLHAFALETPLRTTETTTLGQILDKEEVHPDLRCFYARTALETPPGQQLPRFCGHRLPWSDHPHPERALKALHDLVRSFDRVMTEDEEQIARKLEGEIHRRAAEEEERDDANDAND